MANHHNDNTGNPLESIKEGVESLASVFPIKDLQDIFKADAGKFDTAQNWVNQHLGPVSQMLPFGDSSSRT